MMLCDYDLMCTNHRIEDTNSKLKLAACSKCMSPCLFNVSRYCHMEDKLAIRQIVHFLRPKPWYTVSPSSNMDFNNLHTIP